MKNNLKVVAVGYLKYCPIICLVGKPSFIAKFDAHMESRFGEPEGIYG
jgi:hypothetical protein